MLKKNLVIKTGKKALKLRGISNWWFYALIGFCFLMFSGPLFASVSVVADVDRSRMYDGDTFTYTVSVETTSQNRMSVSEPKLPNLSGTFDILNSQQTSESRTVHTNGDFQVKNKKNYHFMLAPKRTGKIIIEPSKVIVDGTEYSTQPLSVNVLKSEGKDSSLADQNQGQDRYNQRRQRQLKQRRKMRDPFEEMDSLFSQMLRRHGGGVFGQLDSGPPVDPKDAFFIKVVIDKAKVYVGEQVTATWFLYTRGQVRDIDTLKYPSLNGFWKEDIEVATRLNFKREVVDGAVYNKALLASYALFPINAGSITIDSYEAKCSILLPSLGFGKTVQGTKKSQELTLQVMALPEENKPENFSGGVGRFKLTHNLDINSVPAHQPVKLTLRFEGKGNAKLINLPTLNLPEELELYDKKSEAQFFINGTSFKNFELLLVPREEGDLVVPPLEFSAFDPETQEYYSLSTAEMSIAVTQAKEGSKIAAIPLQTNDSEPGKAKEYVPQTENEWDGQPTIFLAGNSTLFWAVFYLVVMGVMVYLFLRELGLTQRKKTLQKLIQARFRKIDQLSVGGDNWRDVGAELTNMIYLCLGAVSGIGGSSLELEKMIEKSPPSVRRELAEEIIKKMKACETISFAPDEVVGNLRDPQNIKQQVKDINKLVTKMIDIGMGDHKGDMVIEKS